MPKGMTDKEKKKKAKAKADTEKWAKKKKKPTTSKDLPPGNTRKTGEKIEKRRKMLKEL